MSPPIRPESDFGKCRSCGQEVRWLTTASGARMPVEIAAKTILIDRGDGQYKAVIGYESHFAYCPQADQHRRDRS